MENHLSAPYSDKVINRLGIACIILFLISYLSHLAALPLDIKGDEGRRALVSLEMMISGDYITPTLNGELFLNKPPLYNWIMVAYLKAADSYGPFWIRLPMIVAIVLFGIFIYRYVSRYCNRMIAMVAAFAFVTNGRIIIYDSFVGLIDLTFGFCMYWLMMLVFEYGEKKKYWQLFIYTYLLTAIGYLMKGLPALAFEAITLLAYFIYTKRFKILFSIQHIVGIVLLAAILGGYYYIYFTKNEIAPEVLFKRLLTESTDRTAVRYGFWYSVFHFIYYPFVMVYHFAPWMLLSLTLLKKNIFKHINANPFIKYNWWIFLANFSIYWISPEVYARYLFPLLAPLFTVLIYLFYTRYKPSDWQRKVPEIIFGCVLVICTLALLVVPFTSVVSLITNAFIKGLICSAMLAGAGWFYFKYPVYRLLTLALAMFIVRIAFNWFVIDQRGAYIKQMEQLSKVIYKATKDKPLYIEKEAYVGNFDGMSYHLSHQRNEILRIKAADTTSYFITDSAHLVGKQYHTLFDFDNVIAGRNMRHVWLVQYKQ